ncbi:Aldehyde dehydrogenase [Leucoagaricus sp. SymC.cos]|nr:Aldehyde dehydrogenase [Leucoagaricus sp. SymC.cos]
MLKTYTQSHFNTLTFRGDVTLNTGLFISGKWVNPVEGGIVDFHCTHPWLISTATTKVLTSIARATATDINLAIDAVQKAFKTSWGPKASSAKCGRIMSRFADLLEKHQGELYTLEALNVGIKTYAATKAFDIKGVIYTMRYKVNQTENKMVHTRHEPYGVVVSGTMLGVTNHILLSYIYFLLCAECLHNPNMGQSCITASHIFIQESIYSTFLKKFTVLTQVNCAQATDMNVPFGGYKQSGMGRELGQYALNIYTQVKVIQMNIGQKL